MDWSTVHVEFGDVILQTNESHLLLLVRDNKVDALGIAVMHFALQNVFTLDGWDPIVQVNSSADTNLWTTMQSIAGNKASAGVKQYMAFTNQWNKSLTQKPDGLFVVKYRGKTIFFINYEADGQDKGKTPDKFAPWLEAINLGRANRVPPQGPVTPAKAESMYTRHCEDNRQLRQTANKMFQAVETARILQNENIPVFTFRSNFHKAWSMGKDKRTATRTINGSIARHSKQQPDWSEKWLVNMYEAHVWSLVQMVNFCKFVNPLAGSRAQRGISDIHTQMFRGEPNKAKKKWDFHFFIGDFRYTAEDMWSTSKREQGEPIDRDNDSRLRKEDAAAHFNFTGFNNLDWNVDWGMFQYLAQDNYVPVNWMIVERFSDTSTHYVDTPDEINGMMTMDKVEKIMGGDREVAEEFIADSTGLGFDQLVQLTQVQGDESNLTIPTHGGWWLNVARTTIEQYFNMMYELSQDNGEYETMWKYPLHSDTQVDIAPTIAILKQFLREVQARKTVRQLYPMQAEYRENLNMHFKAESKSLMAQCCMSIHTSTAPLEDRTRELVAQYNIPSAELFLRMIRCNSFISMQDLARRIQINEHAQTKSPHLQNFYDVLYTFPMGTQSDILFMLISIANDNEPTFSRIKDGLNAEVESD